MERRPGARVEAAADRHARLDAARRAAHLDRRRHAGAAGHPTGDGVRRRHRRGALDPATAGGHEAGLRCLPAPNPAGLGGLVLASASGGCRIAALVDVGTGRLRWRRDLGRRWSHTANDADLYVGGRTVAVPLDYRCYVGKSFDSEPQLLGVLGDTVVASYEISSPLDRTARYYGFDVTTGERRWTTSPDRTFILGRRGDDLLTASLGGPGIAGVIKAGPAGENRAVFVLGQAQQKVDWADGDVRSEQAVDLCEAVRPSTLRSLGFRNLRLPPPAGCQWLETSFPEGSVRRLTVQTFALAPRKDSSAVEFAKRNLADLRHDETNRFRADTRYPGVGDEAWSDQNRRRGDDRSRLLVRYAT